MIETKTKKMKKTMMKKMMMIKMWRAYRIGALERKIENENVYEKIKIIWWED